MKKFLLFLILCTNLSFSQNWSIINSSEKFNYQLDGESIISSTIWVDSSDVSGSDTLFHLNHVVCDSCIVYTSSIPVCDSCYGNLNSNNFMQKEISFDGQNYFLFNPGKIILHPFAQLNDSWLFDSVINVTATVTGVFTDSVFGNIDSIKTIMLSTGDSIQISMNFGILKWMHEYGSGRYYRLIGIEGRNLGAVLPKFDQFFDFDIGDEFEYFKHSIYDHCHEETIRRYTVISKNVYQDSVEYFVEGFIRLKTYGYQGPWPVSCVPYVQYSYGIYTDHFVFIDSATHVTNYYNMQPFSLSKRLFNESPCLNNDSAYEGLRMERIYSANRLIKSFGTAGVNSQISLGSDTLFNTNDFFPVNFPFYSTFVEGLGCTGWRLSPCFEGDYYEYLTAYRKANDSSGTFTDTSLLNKIPIIENISNTFYPNPASNSIVVEDRAGSDVAILSSIGEVVLRRNHISTKEEIVLSQLADGMYIITFSNALYRISSKLFIVKDKN